MINIDKLFITREMTLREAMSILDDSGYGLLLLNNKDGKFEQTVTDGDLRRLLLTGTGLYETLESLPEISSVVIEHSYNKKDALDLMNKQGINHLPVVNDKGRIVSIVSRKDIDQQILLSTPHMGDLEKTYVEEAFKTNWIAPIGPNVDAFETELAEMVGVKHAAALSSGTAAIHLALLVLGVKRGDYVFCSTFTFVASANPIIYQGAEPIFIDSDLESWNMCPVALERAFDSSMKKGNLPKAVIVVNLYGQSANMTKILAICDHFGVPVIEDAAESLGALYRDQPSGTLGKLGIYSFNGNKIITTSGGGMLVSDDGELIEKARFLATQAKEPVLHYQHNEVGYNYRMSNLLAGVGRGQLKVLNQRVEARRNVFKKYKEGLDDIQSIKWMPEPEWSYSNRWLTACIIDANKSGITNSELIDSLARELIEARPLWKPMHLQPIFSGTEYFTADNKSVSEELFESGVCLPSGSNMADHQIDQVIKVIRKFLGH